MKTTSDKVRYRILETWEEREKAAVGVAYQEGDRILFFLPFVRGIKALPVDSVAEISERHFPSGRPNFRWTEVREWEGDLPFHPITALKRQPVESHMEVESSRIESFSQTNRIERRTVDCAAEIMPIYVNQVKEQVMQKL